MLLQVLVEPLGDRVEPQLFVIAPLGHQGDRRRPQTVRFQPGLRRSLLSFGGVGVPVFLGPVAVAGLADVVALPHVCAGATPGLLEHVEHFVLIDRLVDPAVQDLLGTAAGEHDRLVGREHRHPGPLQLPLHRQRFVHLPGDPGHRLTDHHIEPAAGLPGLRQQSGDPTIAGDWDVETLVVGLPPTPVQLHPPRLDVIEMSDDHPRLWQRSLRALQLPQQRLSRILVILRRGPANPRDPNLLTAYRHG